ncbi:VgrG protein [Klebsiella aerogenes]|nr:VgrG protein [Klebsiella aerogenes]
MLLQNASLTLQAPVDQGFGIKIQQPVRVLQGVITSFERLSIAKEETRYALTLQPRLALLSKSHQNRILSGYVGTADWWSTFSEPVTRCAGKILSFNWRMNTRSVNR